MLNKEKIIKRILKPIWKSWYWYISGRDKKEEIKFLNYGYADNKDIELKAEDELERYPLQLYNYIASSINLENLDILEVGCGRGGGASYVARYLKPNSIKAVDISQKAINYCEKRYTSKNLEFIQADAERLPFKNESFDAVINVESSHCYPNISKFFSEVYRVLKPGGYFLYADFRNKKSIVNLEKSIDQTNFEKIKIENITSQIVQALEKDDLRRVDLINRLTPKFMRKAVMDFAGTKNSNTYESFLSGWNIYFFYALRK